MKALLTSFSLLAITVCASAQTALTPAPPKPNPPVRTSPAPATEAVSEYIRFLEAPGAAAPGGSAASVAAAPARLQTAVVRFEKEGVVVDLVGVVHLADAAYFEALNDRLRSYDVVLYEMVGGPHRPDKTTTSDSDGNAVADEIGSVRQLQQVAKAFVGLEYQLDCIDYSAPNFVHADVAWPEMDALMKARNETLFTLFARAMSLPDEGAVPGLPNDDAAAEAMMKRLFSALVSGDSAGLKRTIAPFLSEAEPFITRLEGADGTVLVSERNRVVMEKFAELRQEKKGGTYAIFYGAGHMPDLEKRLLAEGFTKGETTWLAAWTIPAPGTPGATPTGSPVESILRMLSSNPEVMSGLRDLGTTLEDLGGALKSLTVPRPPE